MLGRIQKKIGLDLMPYRLVYNYEHNRIIQSIHTMSYIDALYKKDEDKIYVVERDQKKGRVFVEYDARYVFYYPDARGKHRSITGEPLQKVTCATSKEFIKEQRIRSNKSLYEQDINPVFRCLEENYLDREAPNMHVAFFDICLLYTSPSPRDRTRSRMPSSA